MTADLVNAISNFLVFDDGTYAVHSRVVVTFTTKATPFRAITFHQVPPITVPPVETGLTREEWIKEICKHQTAKLTEHGNLLEWRKDRRDTTRMWKTIFHIFEHGIVQASNLQGKTGHTGRRTLRYTYE